MKKIIIIAGILIISLLSLTELHAQNKPFMAFELKTMRTKHKDAAGQMSDWDKDQKVKNMALAVYIKSESGANDVKIMNYKTGKMDNIIGFEDTKPGKENGNTFITLQGGKDITDKSCSVTIIHPDEDGGLKHARWIKIEVTYDDEVTEYDAKYAD